MFDASANNLQQQGRERQITAASSALAVSAFSADIKRHFRQHYPIFLDGALPRCVDQGYFVRQAQASLRGAGDHLMPSAILQETLATIHAAARPFTKAGLTAISSRRARVWWDNALLDNLDDVLIGLDKPRPVLRFYDVTGLDPDAGQWHRHFDIDVALEDKGKSIDFWTAGQSYVVDLGLLHADGRFLRLARTNVIDLPREGMGAKNHGSTVRSSLRIGGRPVAATIPAPDAKAREWVKARQDTPTRDFAAELMIHMIYRTFLDEGPRAIRRAVKPVRREADVLRREYAKRQQQHSAASKPASNFAVPPIMAIRLDQCSRIRQVNTRLAYPPVFATTLIDSCVRDVLAGQCAAHQMVFALAADFRLSRQTIAIASRMNIAPLAVKPGFNKEVELVCAMPESLGLPDAAAASSVFKAAEILHARMTGMGKSIIYRSDFEFRFPNPVPFAAASGLGLTCTESQSVSGMALTRDDVLANSQAQTLRPLGKIMPHKRPLALEGRMRPGAKLKVAGRLIRADATGCFRLNCVLSPPKKELPLSQDVPSDNKAYSLVNVEWKK